VETTHRDKDSLEQEGKLVTVGQRLAWMFATVVVITVAVRAAVLLLGTDTTKAIGQGFANLLGAG
jgi:hypothetical protein